MSEISKAYEPQSVESKWYQFWLDRNAFTANPHSTKPAYSIVIPPPNVTGVLTLGHVLNNTIQDILARKARMDGKEVLWLPGTDHAGIATENVVSRQIRKEEHKTKQDIGREEFLKRVWTWKEKHGGIILQQLKALGASCDWTRTRFTMDDHYKSCVTRVFVDLYKKGLIYRGKRMVNWCPATLTALSDEEVIMKEQKGALYYFKVEVVEADGKPFLSPRSGGRESAQISAENDQSRLTSAATDDEKVFGPATDVEGRTWLIIATTRPETIPGDTAVAVNPKDPRYGHLIGKHVVRPLPSEFPREQKLIPILGDEQVDFQFGTGVLKVTPAHDKADFEIGQRHKLPVVDIMNPDATMNALAGGPLAGLDRFKARKVAVEQLTELGALEKEEPYTNNVGFSERADVPIEPRLSEQWFLKYPSVKKSKDCVAQPEELEGRAPRVPNSRAENQGQERAGLIPPNEERMHFYPPRWAKVYDHWMSGIQDWCISRQLWWGHRIPVWTKRARIDSSTFGLDWGLDHYVSGEWEQWSKADNKPVPSIRFVRVSDGQVFDPKETSFSPLPPELVGEYDIYYVGENIQESSNGKSSYTNPNSLENFGFAQDPDVLDTWFSSWLWPFATMGWPEKTDTLKKFYPTTDLVTGPDIIFFWVARMIMAGYEWMGDPKFGLPNAMPFRNVYFTGIIRDKQGRKMSKSLGNSPDPLDLIAKYGADALRFGIMRSAPQGQDLLFDEQSVELGRNFCNKLWNACRFRQMQGSAPAQGDVTPSEFEGEIRPELLTSDDKWILLKLDAAIREVTDALNGYRFNEAANALYRFFWSEFCDWYLESAKAALNNPSALTSSPGALDQNAPPASGAPHLTQPSPPLRGGGEGVATPLDPSAAARRENTLAVIDFILANTLRLFHPFLPFITEELWNGMGFNNDLPKDQGGDTIMFARWPKPFDQDMKDFYALDDCYLERVEAKHELVRQGRNLRSEARIAANKKVRFVLKPVNGLPPHDLEVLKNLLNAEQFEVSDAFDPGKGTARALTPLGELFLPMEGLIDVAAERTRLQKELEKIRVEIEKVSQKLSNPSFSQKVPPQVLAEHQQRFADWNAKHAQVLAALESLGQG